jgi:hypothetical protein
MTHGDSITVLVCIKTKGAVSTATTANGANVCPLRLTICAHRYAAQLIATTAANPEAHSIVENSAAPLIAETSAK